MGRPPDMEVVNEVLDGDPLLLPQEACELLGLTEPQLLRKALRGEIPSIQLFGSGYPRRYRTSVITALAPT
jgi:hypothetical protein